MAVWALGINHTTAPLDLRGRFAFAVDCIVTLPRVRQQVVMQMLDDGLAAQARPWVWT